MPASESVPPGFVRFTNSNDAVLYIRQSEIAGFQDAQTRNFAANTLLYLSGQDETIGIKETCEDVINLISQIP